MPLIMWLTLLLKKTMVRYFSKVDKVDSVANCSSFSVNVGKATEAQDILSEGLRLSAKPVQLLHDAMKQMNRRVNLRTMIPSLCANASHFANHTSKPNIASTNDIAIVASTASPPPQTKQQLTKLEDKNEDDDDNIVFKDEGNVMASENAAHVSDPTVIMAMEINPPPPLPPSHTFSSVLLKDKNRSKAESNIKESNNNKAVSFAPTLRMKTASTSNHSIPSKSKTKFGKPVRIQAQKQHTPASLSSSFSDDNTSSTIDKKSESKTLKLTKSDLSYMLNWDPTAPRAKRKLNHNQNNAISEVSLSKVDEKKNEELGNMGTTATYNTIGTSSSGISSLTSATNASSVEVVTAVDSSCDSTSSLHKKQTINESPTTKNVQHQQSESSIPSSVNQECKNNNINTNTVVSSNNSIHHNAFPTLSTPQQHQAAQLHSISSNYSSNNIRSYNDECDPDFLPLVLKKNVFRVNSISYCKLSTIGKGASCKVYKVLSKDHNVYALKKVRLEGMKKKEVDGFSNEINLLKRLRGNPSIIQLIDAQIVLDRKSILVVMELGEVDLHHVLQQQQQSGGSIGKLNINFIRLTWQQMLTAVHSIHEERIVHGDLKPANFLFVRGALKLIDFGIAKAIQSDDTTNIYRDSAMGTVNYMAPEAINGHCDDGRLKLGRASDIWSLGCILYQMLFGRTPFYNLKNMIKKLQAIADPRYKIPYPDNMDVSEAAVDAAKLCLRRNPNDRPPIVADEKNRAQVGLLNNHKFLRS